MQWYSAHYLATSGLVDYHDYFCAATLLLNLDYLRNDEKHFTEGLNFVAQNTDCTFFDQDVLNYCYGNNYIKADEKFDVYVVFERRDKRADQLRPAIYHYVSQCLGTDTKDIFNKLWFKYFSMTPYFNDSVFGNLHEGVKKIHSDQKKFAIKVSSVTSGKTRCFLVPPHNAQAIRYIFSIKPNEEIILFDSMQSLQRMADSIVQSGRKKIFFMLVDNYSQIAKILTDAGLKQDEDFFDGFSFLGEDEGKPFYSYQLIKSL